MKWIKQMQQVLKIALFVASVTLVAAVHAQAAVQNKAMTSAALTTIQSVQVVGEGASASLVVTSSAPVTYTSYKTTAPHRLVIDFSQATPAEQITPLIVDKAAFKRVLVKRYDTEAGVLTRMEIELAQDIEGVIEPVADKAGVLKISFPGFKPAAQIATPATATVDDRAAVNSASAADAQRVPAAASSSNAEKALVTGISAQRDAIIIQASGEIGEFKTFRLNKPERIVVDLMNVKAAPELKMVQLNALGISTARVGTYADKVRVVFDALTGGLSDAKVVRAENGLRVSFESGPVTSSEQPVRQAAATSQKATAAAKVTSNPVVESKNSTAASAPQVEAIDFQVLEGVSRVTIKVSGSPVIDDPQKSSGFVTVVIKGAQLPKSLQRSYEAREFQSPVLRITPIQARSKAGYDTVIRVALRTDAPYQLSRETDMVYLEFKHPATAAPVKAASTQKASQTAKQSAAEPSPEQELAAPAVTPTGKRLYTGRKVTLEFADAEVRKIFQLLSEVSNKNFVLGDEVTGTISLKLVNVPWDQALDIILDTKGLDKREEGNIILIRGKGKFKSLIDEELEIRKSALRSEPLETRMFDVNYAEIGGIVAQFNALKTDRGVITSDARTNKVIVKDVKTALDDMAKLLKSLDVPERQVMIEARIIEASTSFTKSLGIHWGLSTDPNKSSGLGIASLDTSFGGLTSTAPSSGGLFTVVPGAFSDIVFGTIGANVKLAMRLNAAATAGLVKIISTPKVATLNNKTAKITQGQQIPYTSATADKIETKFVEAALSLEVTPHINANGTIIMKIDAKNDAPDRQTSVGTPPINKKQATTEMLLRDGETTVIGGIYVDRETEGSDGVPWLMDIPFFGHLFKSTNTEKSKSELLIFITPRILNPA